MSWRKPERAKPTAGGTSATDQPDRAAAGRNALRLEELGQQVERVQRDLAEAEAAYTELSRSRELALRATHAKLTALQHGVRELETQEALAELTERVRAAHVALDGSNTGGSNLARLAEHLDERRALAVGRTRVAREGLPFVELRVIEADRALLEAHALRRFEATARLPSDTDRTTSLVIENMS